MLNHFVSRMVVTGPAPDIRKLVADLRALPRPCFCLLAIPPPDVFLNPSVPLLGDYPSEQEISEWKARLTPEERQQLADINGNFDEFTEKAYWGCR
jgi:hypothetical protein